MATHVAWQSQLAMPTIPIRNIYYLFLYAWARFPEGQQVEAGIEDGPDLPNLLAKVLSNGARRLLRRGVLQGYVTFVDELRAPRGRVLIEPSVATGLLRNNRLICAVDELSPDVLPNRILKTTLRRLAAHNEIKAPLGNEMRALARQLGPIDEVRLSGPVFRHLSIPRNNGHYDLLMRVCEMVFQVLQPDESGTGSTFAALLEDEERMSTIFEQFVRNFLSLHVSDYLVAAENIAWDTEVLDELHARYLPAMRTDVLLRSEAETVVVDAKYYKDTFVSYRGGHPRIRSGHLYQILTYLEHTRRGGHDGRPVRGVLIYPSTDGQEVVLQYKLGSSSVGIRTIDFTRSWNQIHEQMLSIVGCPDEKWTTQLQR